MSFYIKEQKKTWRFEVIRSTNTGYITMLLLLPYFSQNSEQNLSSIPTDYYE